MSVSRVVAVSDDFEIDETSRPTLAVSGESGHSITGDRGRSITGDSGTAVSGYLGYARSGDRGQSISGDMGISITGVGGVAMTGTDGMARAGFGGVIVFAGEGNDGIKFVLSADVGHDSGVLADTFYRLVDRAFVPVSGAHVEVAS